LVFSYAHVSEWLAEFEIYVKKKIYVGTGYVDVDGEYLNHSNIKISKRTLFRYGLCNIYIGQIYR